MRFRAVMLTIIGGLLAAVAAAAGPIALGNLSFNVQIPSGATPGVATFTLANLTGALEFPPGYPVTNEIDLVNAVLVINYANSSQTINLGTITPGVVDDSVDAALAVSLANPVVSASFSGDLSDESFALDPSLGGGTVLTTDGFVSAMLTDPNGFLMDGDNLDLVVSAAPPQPSTVPEPAPAMLLGAGLLVLAGAEWGRRRFESKRLVREE